MKVFKDFYDSHVILIGSGYHSPLITGEACGIQDCWLLAFRTWTFGVDGQG